LTDAPTVPTIDGSSWRAWEAGLHVARVPGSELLVEGSLLRRVERPGGAGERVPLRWGHQGADILGLSDRRHTVDRRLPTLHPAGSLCEGSRPREAFAQGVRCHPDGGHLAVNLPPRGA